MKEELKCKLPNWYENIDANQYYMVLSNDFDSYYSCVVLNQMFGIQIGGYFSLNDGLYLNQKYSKGEPIYVDLSITHGKCFDNHLTIIKNPECINPNIITKDYYKKYNGSTFAFLCALFGRNLSAYNVKQLTTLIAIDGWFAGYYKYDGRFRDTTIKWMELFEVDKYLLPILKNHDTQYFYNFIDQHKLNQKIVMQNNYLYCKAKINIPTYKFQLKYKVRRDNLSKYAVQNIYNTDSNSIITAAETFRNQYSVCRAER